MTNLLLTVCITTYNRAGTTIQLIKNLHYIKEVEYIIVDDGSELLEHKKLSSFISENNYPITLLLKNNGGKLSSLMHGLQYAKGLFFTDLDSDDLLTKNNLSNIISCIKQTLKLRVVNSEIIGVIGKVKYDHIAIKNDDFPNENEICNYFKMRADYGIQGDKVEVVLTSELRNITIPFFENEKRMPSPVLWGSVKGTFLLTNKIFNNYYTDRTDRISNTKDLIRIKSKNSSRLENKIAILSKHLYSSNIFYLNHCSNYFRYSFHGASPIIESSILKKIHFSILITIPVGFAMYIWDLLKMKLK